MPDPSGSTPPDSSAPGPAPAGGTTGRDRLLATFRRPSRAQAVVAVLLALVGFAAVTQVRTSEANDTYEGLREQDLIEVLSGLTGAADRARREIDRLEGTRNDLQSRNNGRQAALDQAEQRMRTLNVLAGLVPVTGPGLRITIEEVDGRVTVGSLLDLVQELRTAGAEAMEFNNTVRVVAQSSFDATVGGIELDDTLLEAPYVIEVIGEPHTLRGGLTFADGPIAQLEDHDGAEVAVDELDVVEIESVRELERPERARADEPQ